MRVSGDKRIIVYGTSTKIYRILNEILNIIDLIFLIKRLMPLNLFFFAATKNSKFMLFYKIYFLDQSIRGNF